MKSLFNTTIKNPAVSSSSMEASPGRYEYLPHTADAKFKAWGNDLSELFANAATATFAILTDVTKVQPKLRFPLKLQSKNKEAALFDFLDELLFLLDTEGFLLRELDNLRVEETRAPDGKKTVTVAGTAVGDHYKEYEVNGNVKAVTYNDMYLKQLPDGRWECQVVVDL